MQVELLEAKTTFGPLGRRRSPMSAATSPGTGLSGSAPPHGPLLVLRTSGQHRAAAGRRGPKPAISDQALLVAIDSRSMEPSPS